VREKIDRGLEDVEQGRVISQEGVERRMRKWTGE
jgi:predicted transcriptional regulator